ncbi:HupE/UreJ family protein [Cupriavidus sp. DB3]|uniref:HupE/UreJ family protein n=1 Tax=Cupriavidus sp. DB3 TaxID=2873259 RepID=UPI001CF1F412|nr:HupE/UreJ family protein [Cupriavidus sp. DB3]MCA7086270.1 HupE/UreJ family protein [Cupriavidus sp. DB3]
MPRGLARAATHLAASATVLGSAPALAHPGHDVASVGASLASGLLHPLTGADHLLAMVAVGVWSALAVGTAGAFGSVGSVGSLGSFGSFGSVGAGGAGGGVLRVPLTFVALMLVGAALGLAGVALPAVEPMIAASLLVVGLLVALRARLPAGVAMALVGGFAVFHGYAHGAELPPSAGALPAVLAYVSGFAAATMALHLAGIAAGTVLRRHAPWLARAAGAGVALYGVGLMVA